MPSANNWLLCRECSNAYPAEPPNIAGLDRLWSGNRDLSNVTEVEADRIQKHRIAISALGARRAVQIFRPHIKGPPARILDIACGYGETVKAFGCEGYDSFGVDADASTKPHHEEIGVKTLIGQIEDVDLHGPFDAILVSHAIYFITEPMNFLRRVHDLLADDGIFCLTNADFMNWRDRARPNHHHTFYPTDASMRVALSIAGFKSSPPTWCAGSLYYTATKAQRCRTNVNSHKTWLQWALKPITYSLFGSPFNRAKSLIR